MPTGIYSGYKYIDKLWTDNRWEIICVCSIIILFICWMLRGDREYVPYTTMIDTSVLSKPKTHGRSKKNERECKRIVEQIYGVEFKTVRPHFLKNPRTGRNLELDLYNEKLRLAFEYNGMQHRVYTPYFHKSESHFQDQVYRDTYKANQCREMGIRLIVIPDTVRYCDLESHIRSVI